MSYLSEFPDYDGKLYIPEGFKDNSWHNDTMPKAEKVVTIPTYPAGTEIEVAFIIWQDYTDPELREYEDGKRYIFQINVNENPVFEYQTDDLSTIEMFVECIDD